MNARLGFFDHRDDFIQLEPCSALLVNPQDSVTRLDASGPENRFKLVDELQKSSGMNSIEVYLSPGLLDSTLRTTGPS